jgi:hypothetical protein
MMVEESQDHKGHIGKHQEALDEDDLTEDAIAALEQNIADHKAFLAGEKINADQAYGRAFGTRWPFEDFAMDWMSQDGLNDAQWIAFKVVKPIEEVRADKTFMRKARNDVKPTGRPKDAPVPMSFDGGDDDFALVTYWEIYARQFNTSPNRRINLMAVVAEQDNGGMLLRHGRWGFEDLMEYPCELLTYNQGVHKSWFGKPYLLNAGAENTQAIMNEMYDAVLNTIRKHKTVIGYDPDAIGEDAAMEVVDSPDNVLVPIKGLAGGIQPLQSFELLSGNFEAMDFSQFLRGNFNQAAGTPQPGMSDGDTATEAAINERKVTAREDDRDELFEEYQTASARKMWIIQSEFGREDLPDVFRFEIDVAGRSVTTAVERRQWNELLQTFVGLTEISLSLNLPPPNLPAIAEQLLVRGFDINNPEDLWPAIGLDGVPEQLNAVAQQPGIPLGVDGTGGVPTQGPITTSEVDVMQQAISGR